MDKDRFILESQQIKKATPLESLFNLLNLNAFAVGEGLEPPRGG